MSNHQLSKELEVAKLVAQKVGNLQIKYFKSKLEVIRKSRKDLVSNVDIECQKLSTKLLTEDFDYGILSEEKRIKVLPETEYFWIIDPIDGTHNYISGLPLFGISIALATKSEFLLGVIYLPLLDEMYFATKGQGSFLNDKRIHVSRNKDIEKSMINFDNQLHDNKNLLSIYGSIIDNSFTTRILGSAILDLGFVSSGIIDARVFSKTKVFDFAAGLTIVDEAGGKVTNFRGAPVTIHSTNVLATNGYIHDVLLELIKKHL